MADHDVLIAGAGPTGLMLAAELALAGVDTVVLERRTDHDLVGSRAGGMTSRTLEVLDQRGVVDRFVAQGVRAQNVHYSGIHLDITDLPTRHNYSLALLQHRIERLLAQWAVELGARIEYGSAVEDFDQDAGGVTVALSNGQTRRAAYLVGCDGGRSTVRKRAGIAFPGWDPSTSCLVADVEMEQQPPWGMHRAGGFHSFFRFESDGPVRVLVTERRPGSTTEPDVNDISDALVATRGTDYGLRSASWVSRFTDMTRQASTYRDRRVLLAGDAAHVHFPIGGQGLNTGIQDAVNLGWKLGQVIAGTSPDALLDTYGSERHPVAARVLRNTMAQTALNGPGARVDALRDDMSDILSLAEPRARIAAMMCALDITYGVGGRHPLVGRRMPDLDVLTPAGPTRVSALLHTARAALLDFGGIDLTRFAGRVRVVGAEYSGRWELPVLGQVPAPDAVLVRPDGHVAWVSEGGDDSGLLDALDRWCGVVSPRHG